MTELICIICPKGCHLMVDEEHAFEVSGFGCERGKAYGKKELSNPTRTLTSVVRIEGALHPCCPVKTSGDIPKKEIMRAMAQLKGVTLHAPVSIGDVVVKNICDTGVDWVVTKDM